MTLAEIKNTAFAKWLLLQDEGEALSHIWDCLCRGKSEENMAWQLLTAVHGERFMISMDQVEEMLKGMLNALRPEMEKAQ